MHIIFISTGIYPDQHAAAIRHTTIAQGFYENGHSVNFLLLNAQKWINSEIEYKGVRFKTFNNYNGNNRVLRIFFFFKALTKIIKTLNSINRNTKIDGIVVFAIDVIVVKALLLYSKKNQIKIFHERTELPYVVGRERTLLGNIKYYFYINKFIPQFDGIFVISNKLKEYLSKFNKNIEKVLTVVDPNFFIPKNQRIYEFPYIAYCGTMRGTKDGVPILVEAFSMLSKKFPSHKLLLIGNNTDKTAIKETIDTISKLNIQEKVVFTGLVDRNEMPNLLCHADLLVVSKPDNEQNSGNFPIKIGEYLSTGVPIVVTSVGEIPKFITDRKTGFLAIPNSSKSFFRKMEEALTDYENAKKVGLKGKEIAENVFNYRIQAKIMADFINKTGEHNGN